MPSGLTENKIFDVSKRKHCQLFVCFFGPSIFIIPSTLLSLYIIYFYTYAHIHIFMYVCLYVFLGCLQFNFKILVYLFNMTVNKQEFFIRLCWILNTLHQELELFCVLSDISGKKGKDSFFTKFLWSYLF